VRFVAPACDYDGTLPSQDHIGDEALAALESAHQAGLRLVLGTGRTFFDLTRVCERLDRFDGVVADNGAVVYFPRQGTIRDQAPPPPPRLLAELDHRGPPLPGRSSGRRHRARTPASAARAVATTTRPTW